MRAQGRGTDLPEKPRTRADGNTGKLDTSLHRSIRRSVGPRQPPPGWKATAHTAGRQRAKGVVGRAPHEEAEKYARRAANTDRCCDAVAVTVAPRGEHVVSKVPLNLMAARVDENPYSVANSAAKASAVLRPIRECLDALPVLLGTLGTEERQGAGAGGHP